MGDKPTTTRWYSDINTLNRTDKTFLISREKNQQQQQNNQNMKMTLQWSYKTKGQPKQRKRQQLPDSSDKIQALYAEIDDESLMLLLNVWVMWNAIFCSVLVFIFCSNYTRKVRKYIFFGGSVSSFCNKNEKRRSDRS